MNSSPRPSRAKAFYLRMLVRARRKVSQLRDLITAAVASYLLFTLIINPLFFDAGPLASLADMGVDEIESGDDGQAQEAAALNRLDNAQLRFILDAGISAGFSTETQAAEARLATDQLAQDEPAQDAVAESSVVSEEAVETTEEPHMEAPSPLHGALAERNTLVFSLLSEFGVFFHGPFQTDRNRWELTIFRYNPDSATTTAVAKELDRPENLYSALQPIAPVVAIRIVSQTGLWSETSMHYQVQLLGKSRVHSTTPLHPLFVRSSWTGLPVRPIQISLEPEEFGAAVVRNLEELEPVGRWLEREGSFDFSSLSQTFDRKSRERLTQLFAGTIRVLMSDHATHFDLNHHEEMGHDHLTGLPQSFASQLAACRIVNGVNNGGLLNFLIFVLVLWGMVSLLSHGGAPIEVALKRADDLIGLLPMLGFLGTLYGMLLAFAASGGGGSDLISYIGISLDTTILAVCGSILLNGTLMWKVRRLEASGRLPAQRDRS